MADLNQGQSYSYNDNPSRAGTYTHAWTFSDGTASGTGNPINHTWPNVGPVTATATATDAYGTIRTASRTDNVIGIQDGANSMAVARANPSVIQLANGKILISGGWTNSGAVATATCELFDPSNGTFTNTGSMGTARAYHRLTLLADGRVLATGGGTGSAQFLSGGFDGEVYHGTPSVFQLATCEFYDPTAGTWSAAPSMPGRMSAHRQFMGTHGKVVATGGYEAQSSTSVYVYDPALNSWSTISVPNGAYVWQNPWGADYTGIGGWDSGSHWDSLTPTVVSAYGGSFTVRGQIIAKGRYNNSYSNGIFALDDDGFTSTFGLPDWTDQNDYNNAVPQIWNGEWNERLGVDFSTKRNSFAGSFMGYDGYIYHVGGHASSGMVDNLRYSPVSGSSPHTGASSFNVTNLWKSSTVQPTGLASRVWYAQRLIHSVDRKKFYLIGGGKTTSTIETSVYGFNIQTGAALAAIMPTTPRHMPGIVRLSSGKWILFGGFANIGSPTALSSYAYAMF